MTLIITIATANQVVQASDRRLTCVDGSIYDDESNKAACAVCRDSHFAIAYTGLAHIGKERKKTDEWLVDYLESIHAAHMDLVSIGEALKEEATAFLRATAVPRKHKGIAFVFTGYCHGWPFFMSISNREEEDLDHIGEVKEEFQIQVEQMKVDANPRRALLVDIAGTEEAVDKSIRQRIKRLNRKRFFHVKDGKVVAQELVSLIRAATRTPQFGKWVGRNCMTVVVKPRSGDCFDVQYHPDRASPQMYAPHLIVPGGAFKNIQMWRGAGPPPWWHSP